MVIHQCPFIFLSASRSASKRKIKTKFSTKITTGKQSTLTVLFNASSRYLAGFLSHFILSSRLMADGLNQLRAVPGFKSLPPQDCQPLRSGEEWLLASDAEVEQPLSPLSSKQDV